jgi:hypothetical protein
MIVVYVKDIEKVMLDIPKYWQILGKGNRFKSKKRKKLSSENGSDRNQGCVEVGRWVGQN